MESGFDNELFRMFQASGEESNEKYNKGSKRKKMIAQEDIEFKRKKRKEQNRLSAEKSRIKVKENVKQLEHQVGILTQENELLKQTVRASSIEVSSLEELLAQIRVLKDESKILKDESSNIKAENKDLKAENKDLKAENKDLKAENKDLKGLLYNFFLNPDDSIQNIAGVEKKVDDVAPVAEKAQSPYCDFDGILFGRSLSKENLDFVEEEDLSHTSYYQK